MDESRRSLEMFLYQHDPSRVWGGLSRIAMQDGHVLFCCRKCLTGQRAKDKALLGQIQPGETVEAKISTAAAAGNQLLPASSDIILAAEVERLKKESEDWKLKYIDALRAGKQQPRNISSTSGAGGFIRGDGQRLAAEAEVERLRRANAVLEAKLERHKAVLAAEIAGLEVAAAEARAALSAATSGCSPAPAAAVASSTFQAALLLPPKAGGSKGDSRPSSAASGCCGPPSGSKLSKVHPEP